MWAISITIRNSNFPLLGHVLNAFSLCCTEDSLGGDESAQLALCVKHGTVRPVLYLQSPTKRALTYWEAFLFWQWPYYFILLIWFSKIYTLIFLYINPWNYVWKAHAINTTRLMHMPGVDKIHKKQTNLRIIISLYHPSKSSQLFRHFNYKVTFPVLKYCGLCNKSFPFIYVMILTTVEESFYNPSPLQRQRVNKKLNNITIKFNKNIVSVLNLLQHMYMQ